MQRSRARLLAPVVALAVTLTACGSATTTSTGSSAATAPTVSSTASSATEQADRSAKSPLPELEVVDIATGQQVQLASLVPADKPTLLWFWAPH